MVLPPRGLAGQDPGRGQEPDLDPARGITHSFQLPETASMKHSSTGARHHMLWMCFVGNSPCGHCAVGRSLFFHHLIHLPAPLCYTSITRFLRSYGCSDSSTAGQGRSTSSTHTFLSSIEVSQLHVLNLPSIPSSTTPCLPSIAFSRYPSAWTASPCGGLGFATVQQARQDHQAESGSSSYGLLVHLQLLSTPPHGDAVTFGFRPESAYLRRTFTVLIEYARWRTGPRPPGAVGIPISS